MYTLSCWFVIVSIFCTSFSVEGTADDKHQLAAIAAFVATGAATMLYLQRPYRLQKQEQAKKNEVQKFVQSLLLQEENKKDPKKHRFANNLPESCVSTQTSFDFKGIDVSTQTAIPLQEKYLSPHKKTVAFKIVKANNAPVLQNLQSLEIRSETAQDWLSRLKHESYDSLHLAKNAIRLDVALHKLHLTDPGIKTAEQLKAKVEQGLHDKYIGLDPILDVELYALQRQIAHTKKTLHAMDTISSDAKKYYQDIIIRLQHEEQSIIKRRNCAKRKGFPQ